MKIIETAKIEDDGFYVVTDPEYPLITVFKWNGDKWAHKGTQVGGSPASSVARRLYNEPIDSFGNEYLKSKI